MMFSCFDEAHCQQLCDRANPDNDAHARSCRFELMQRTRQRNQAAEQPQPQTEGAADTPAAAAAGAATPAAQAHSAAQAEKIQNAVRACTSAHQNAKRYCNGKMYAQGAAAIISIFTSARAAGNIKEACQSASKIAGAAMVTNAGLGIQCERFAQNCIRECQKVSTLHHASLSTTATQLHDEEDADAEVNKDDCISFRQGAELIKDQAVSDAKTYADSKLCIQAASAFGDCSGDKAYDNPKCPQYCQSPVHMREEICSRDPCVLAQNKNSLQCFCPGNPLDPRCAGQQNAGTPGANNKPTLATIPGGKGGVGTTPGFDLGDGDGDDQEFEGYESKGGKAASTAYEDNKGGGLGGGGGGLGGNMGGNGRGKQEGPYNTDIIKGTAAAGGGGSAVYGGGGGVGGGYGGGRDRDRDGDGSDWRKYMPTIGGKGRAPASANAELFNNGITQANGLSNFEKVTRKMNEKRAQLLS